MENIKRRFFSELLKLGLPMGSFKLSIQNDKLLVEAFNLKIYEDKLPETFEEIDIIYKSRI